MIYIIEFGTFLLMRDSKKGEIATIITLGALIFIAVSTLVSSAFINNKAQTSITKADGKTCTEFPTFSTGEQGAPPAGYYWQADCLSTTLMKPEIRAARIYCVDSSECIENTTYPDHGYIGANSNFCYTFGSQATDQRCMILHHNSYPHTPLQSTGNTGYAPSCAGKPNRAECQEDYMENGIQCHKRGQCTEDGGRKCQWMNDATHNSYCGNPTNTPAPPTNTPIPRATNTPVPLPTNAPPAQATYTPVPPPYVPPGGNGGGTTCSAATCSGGNCINGICRAYTPVPGSNPPAQPPASGGGSCASYTPSITAGNYNACVGKSGCAVLETVGSKFECVPGNATGPLSCPRPYTGTTYTYKWHYYNTDSANHPAVYVCGRAIACNQSRGVYTEWGNDGQCYQCAYGSSTVTSSSACSTTQPASGNQPVVAPGGGRAVPPVVDIPTPVPGISNKCGAGLAQDSVGYCHYVQCFSNPSDPTTYKDKYFCGTVNTTTKVSCSTSNKRDCALGPAGGPAGGTCIVDTNGDARCNWEEGVANLPAGSGAGTTGGNANPEINSIINTKGTIRGRMTITAGTDLAGIIQRYSNPNKYISLELTTGGKSTTASSIENQTVDGFDYEFSNVTRYYLAGDSTLPVKYTLNVKYKQNPDENSYLLGKVENFNFNLQETQYKAPVINLNLDERVKRIHLTVDTIDQNIIEPLQLINQESYFDQKGVLHKALEPVSQRTFKSNDYLYVFNNPEQSTTSYMSWIVNGNCPSPAGGTRLIAGNISVNFSKDDPVVNKKYDIKCGLAAFVSVKP